MKGFIITHDKLAADVLKRALQENAIDDVIVVEPNPKASNPLLSDVLECLIFLDFDVPQIDQLFLTLPQDGLVIPIGSYQSKSKVPSSLASQFLLKPFMKDVIWKTLHKVLLSSIEQLPTQPHSTSISVNDPILLEWKQCIDSVAQRRKEISPLFLCDTHELYGIIGEKVAFDAQGRPSVDRRYYPLQHALLVDNDPKSVDFLKEHFEKTHFTQVDITSSGLDGWNKIQLGSYDVIVIRWELTDLSGLALYNRLRTNIHTKNVPILVISNKVSHVDFRLFDEDSAILRLAFPPSTKDLSKCLSEVITSSIIAVEFLPVFLPLVQKTFTSHGTIDLKSLTSKAGLDSLLFDVLMVVGDNSLETNHFELAERAYGEAWRLGDRRLSIFTGYAKACFLNGNSQRARRILSSADALAPHSVSRLCLLGEISLTDQKIDEAREAFQKVLAIDDSHEKARAGLEVAKVLDSDDSGQSMQNMAKSIRQFPSYLNLIGIKLSRSGRLVEGLRYYKAALAFVYPKDLQAKVWFNIGLLNLRAQKQADALSAFAKALELSNGQLLKAAKYMKAQQAEVPIPVEDPFAFEKF